MDNSNNNWKNESDSGDGLRNIFKVRFEMLSIRSQLRNLIKKEIITYSQILEKEKFNVKIYICRKMQKAYSPLQGCDRRLFKSALYK